MEGMTACRQRVESLHCRARAQIHALGVLEKAFAQNAECLRRHDQARCLDDLRVRVTREVRDVQQMETIASSAFTKAMLISGLAKLALGSVLALARRSEEHPLVIGTRLAQSAFEGDAPFGTVIVAVGSSVVPDDVKVVALSQQARQSGKAESEVVAALEASGYRVMTPESFSIALNELKRKVLTGILALPVEASSLGRHHEGLPGSQ